MLETISIGRYGEKEVSFDVSTALNKHILLLGKSGAGKSVEAQKIILNLVQQGQTVIALDIHSTLSDSQIFGAYRSSWRENINEIDVYQNGISLDLFSPVKDVTGNVERQEDVVAAILATICRVISLGDRQKSVLRQAIFSILDTGEYSTNGLGALDVALRRMETTRAEAIREKLYPIIARNIFRSGAMDIKEGKINVIRLGRFDIDTQELVSELLLSHIWRLALSGKFIRDGIHIFIDEFQNLPMSKKSVLAQMLTEGRKFNCNLILATQQIALGGTADAQQRLMQCGLVLLFQPSITQATMMARLIEAVRAEEWTIILKMLRQGEFVAVGNLLVDGLSVARPLKVSARREEVLETAVIYSVNGRV